MKLKREHLGYIGKVVRTAQIAGIENIIIEPDLVRAIDDKKQVVLYQDQDVPDMPFGSIGLNRINVFTSRINIAEGQSNFTVEAVVDDGKEFARSLLMKGKGIKVDYRCANPTTIEAPRQVHDVMTFKFKLTDDAVTLLQKGQQAMDGPELVSIISNQGVTFELVDINSDVLSYDVANKVENIVGDTNTKFAYRYPIKVLLALFKSNRVADIYIGKKGMLRIDINGLNIFVLPKV